MPQIQGSRRFRTSLNPKSYAPEGNRLRKSSPTDSWEGLGSRGVTTRTMGASTSLSRYSIPTSSPCRSADRLTTTFAPAKLGDETREGARGRSCCRGDLTARTRLWCGGKEPGAQQRRQCASTVSSPVSSQSSRPSSFRAFVGSG